MKQSAIEILEAQRIMAIATVRPDGWPQNTIVGYANDGLLLYFMISPKSQKFMNIQHDNRVCAAIGAEPNDLRKLKAVYAGATAAEVTDPEQRKHAWQLLLRRHPNLRDFELPKPSEAAMMCATCRYVSILDYTKGLGHTDTLTVSGPDLTEMDPARHETWGVLPSSA